MITFDFFAARTKHTEWKMKLKNYFKTGEGLSQAQAKSERDCELGKWLYGDGLKKYASIAEMHKLEAAHKAMHMSVRAAIVAKDANNMTAANAELDKVGRYSEEINRLLTSIEAQVKKIGTPVS